MEGIRVTRRWRLVLYFLKVEIIARGRFTGRPAGLFGRLLLLAGLLLLLLHAFLHLAELLAHFSTGPIHGNNEPENEVV